MSRRDAPRGLSVAQVKRWREMASAARRWGLRLPEEAEEMIRALIADLERPR
jgi:hypothetical protein